MTDHEPKGMDWGEVIARHLSDGAAVRLATIDACTPNILEAALCIVEAIRNGGKVMFCGNGGSAADAQHLAAELVGRYLREREAIAAIALTTDTSVLTAIGNDSGYANVFERQVRALSRPTDVLIAISTSGESESVIRAVVAAKELGVATIGLTGQGHSRVAQLVDVAIQVPSLLTPFIQEAHIAIGHVICELIEVSVGSAGQE